MKHQRKPIEEFEAEKIDTKSCSKKVAKSKSKKVVKSSPKKVRKKKENAKDYLKDIVMT